MTQTISAGNLAVALGPAYTSGVGIRVDDLAGVEYLAFTTASATQLDVAGTWLWNADLTIPDAGATVYFGTSSTDLFAWPMGPDAGDVATSAEIAALNDLSAAEVNAEVDTALADYDPPTNAEMLAAFAALNDVTAAEIAAALSGTKTVTAVSTVNAGVITVYRGDTWSFSVSVSGVTLTDYEVVALVAKEAESDTDNAAILHLRSGANGLQKIGGADPSDTSAGTLTVNSDTKITVLVSRAETTSVTPTDYATWYIVGYDQTPTPNQKFHRVMGKFVVENYWLQATA